MITPLVFCSGVRPLCIKSLPRHCARESEDLVHIKRFPNDDNVKRAGRKIFKKKEKKKMRGKKRL